MRPALTGDRGGARNDPATQGITLDLEGRQIFQGNARGGKDTDSGFRCSGSAEFTLTFF